jgi:hypothetical protein
MSTEGAQKDEVEEYDSSIYSEDLFLPPGAANDASEDCKNPDEWDSIINSIHLS